MRTNNYNKATNPSADERAHWDVLEQEELRLVTRHPALVEYKVSRV